MGFYNFRYSIALVFLKWYMYLHFSLIFQSPYFACMFNGSWRESLLSEIDLQIPDPAIDNLGNTSEQGMKVIWFIWRYIISCMVFLRIYCTTLYENWSYRYCSSEQHIPYNCDKCSFKSVFFSIYGNKLNLKKEKKIVFE